MTVLQWLTMCAMAASMLTLSSVSACTHVPVMKPVITQPAAPEEPKDPPAGPEDPDGGAEDAPAAAEAPEPTLGLHKPSWEKHFILEVTLRGEIDDDSEAALAKVVQAINASHHDPRQDPVEAVVLVLDTPGGSLPAGAKMTKDLQELETPLVCAVDGHAYSMGFFLLQGACPVRLETSRSALMAHEPHFSGKFIIEDPKRWALQGIIDELRVETDSWFDICAQRMGLTLEQFYQHVRNAEWWMTAKEALAAHAVDAMVDNLHSQVEQPLMDNLQLPAGLPQLPAAASASPGTSFAGPAGADAGSVCPGGASCAPAAPSRR